jgi:lysophospholipase L1-like esterase
MPQAMLSILLGPLLLMQGLWVRLRTPILPEPDGARVGRTGAGPPLRLLVLGDSSAAGVGAAAQSEALLGRLVEHLGRDYTVFYRLVAATGATTKDTLNLLTKEDPGPHDVVVTALGLNDLTGGRKLEAWLADQKRLLDLLLAKCQPRVILISSLPPVHRFPALPQPLRWYLGTGAKTFNAARQALARATGTLFLSLDFALDVSQMASDGFHPGGGVYREWGQRAAERIRERLAKGGPGPPGAWPRKNIPDRNPVLRPAAGGLIVAGPAGDPIAGREGD